MKLIPFRKFIHFRKSINSEPWSDASNHPVWPSGAAANPAYPPELRLRSGILIRFFPIHRQFHWGVPRIHHGNHLRPYTLGLEFSGISISFKHSTHRNSYLKSDRSIWTGIHGIATRNFYLCTEFPTSAEFPTREPLSIRSEPFGLSGITMHLTTCTAFLLWLS